MYPCVECNRKKLLQNIETVARMLHADHRIMCAVIKGFCADNGVMEILDGNSGRQFLRLAGFFPH